MKINVYNRQDKLKLSAISVKKQIRELLNHEQVGCDEISLHFVDEKTIKSLHKKFFDDPTPTDCISFPIDQPIRTGEYCFLGEIFVSTDAAIKYGKEFSVNPYDEATLYIIHGLLHLIGFDDISEKDKTIMRKKRKKLYEFY